MRKKTKNRHGGFGLQVLLLMLVMLVGGTTNIQAQSYITDVIVLGDGISGVNAKNLKNEYTNKGWTVLEQDLNQGNGGWYVFIAYKTSSTANPIRATLPTSARRIKKWINLPLMGVPTTRHRPTTASSTATSTEVLTGMIYIFITPATARTLVIMAERSA